MNITNTELTTKADVVVDKKKSDPKEERGQDPVKKDQDPPEQEESAEILKFDDPLGDTGHSYEERSKPLVDERDRIVKEHVEHLVTTLKSTTTNIEVLVARAETTPHTLKEKDPSVNNPGNHIDTVTEINPAGNLDNSSDSNNDEINDKTNNQVQTNQGSNNNKDNRSSTPTTTSSNNNNNRRTNKFDQITVKYTTIFLRLFAPESTTTAEPKLGHVQQELPGQKQESDEFTFQQGPLVDKPQIFDVEHKVNTTSSTSLTPSIPTSSLSTQYTTTSTPQVPVTLNSTVAASLKEVPTNGKSHFSFTDVE